jgi:hypothetical protein
VREAAINDKVDQHYLINCSWIMESRQVN